MYWRESESEVAQSYPTLCDPVDCSTPGSSSMGFSRQEYWSGLPFPSPRDLLDPGIEPGSPTLESDALTSEAPGVLTWKVPFLHLKERSILISEDKGVSRRILNLFGLAKLNAVQYSYFILHLSYSSTTIHTSSNLAYKYSSVFFGSSFPYGGPIAT